MRGLWVCLVSVALAGAAVAGCERDGVATPGGGGAQQGAAPAPRATGGGPQGSSAMREQVQQDDRGLGHPLTSPARNNRVPSVGAQDSAGDRSVTNARGAGESGPSEVGQQDEALGHPLTSPLAPGVDERR